MLRVLTLSTLFPDVARKQFGIFVEKQTLALAAHPEVELHVVAPVGLPPWPLSSLSHYRSLGALPIREAWKGVAVHRPRFLHIPGAGGRFDSGALTRAVLPMLRDLRQEFPFDVIDAEFFFPDGVAAAALGESLGVPVSIKARGSDIHYWARQNATRGAVIAAGNRVGGLLAVSAALKRDMVKLGMPEERITVHHTGIDHSVFHPGIRSDARSKYGREGSLIVSVGTLSNNKGQSLIIDAMYLLKDAHLVLIGAGPEKTKLEAQAAPLGERVRFTGAISQDEIADWLAAADVMCLPSASEGLANAWIEALACGTPIVITDVGGAREVLSDPIGGAIVERTTAAIALAISKVIAARADPRQVSKIAASFSWEANRDALYAHLARLR